MNAPDPAIGGPPTYSSLKMMIARQRVADLRRGPDGPREPREPRPVGATAKRLGRSSKLANGSWLYGHRDSS